MKKTVYNTANNPRMEVNPSEDKSRIKLSGQRRQVAAIRIIDVLLVNNEGILEDLSNAEKMSPSNPV